MHKVPVESIPRLTALSILVLAFLIGGPVSSMAQPHSMPLPSEAKPLAPPASEQSNSDEDLVDDEDEDDDEAESKDDADSSKDTAQPAAKEAPKKAAKKAKPAPKKVAKKAKKAAKKPAKKAKKVAKKAKKVAKKAPVFRESNGAFAHAILVNGGQRPRINFYSHVLYLRMMRQLMNELGMEDRNISIIAGDGDSAKPDQAIMLEERRPEQWLFAFRPEERFFPRSPSIINTVIKGKRLITAKKKVINKFTKKLATKVKKSKKPVFLFVTDHGTPNRKLKHHRNNRISLWRENWSVRQFHKSLRPFGRRRVIYTMSQCFSGSFLWSVFRKPGRFGIPNGDRCGFFATLPSRYAYGCFPETRLKKQVGHAYRFILAMRRAKTFDEAHREVLLTDMTPDVPHRSSDGYLYAMLTEDAKADGIKPHVMVDKILARFKERSYPGMKDDLALISAISQRFGLIRPINLATLMKQAKGLTKRRRWWERVEGLWRNVYATARNHHLSNIYKNNKKLWKNVRPLMKQPRKFFMDLYKKNKGLKKSPQLLGLIRLGAVYPKVKRQKSITPRVEKLFVEAESPCAPAPAPAPSTPPPPPGKRGPSTPPPPPGGPKPPFGAPRRTPGIRSVTPPNAKLWAPEKTISILRSEFMNYVQARPRLLNRLRMLYLKKKEMSSHVFLIKTQLAALKRIEVLYYRIAGRLLVQHDKHPEFQAYREGVKRLIACENTPLRPKSFKSKTKKLKDLQIGVNHPPLPSWFGIQFRPIPPKKRGALPTGAVVVDNVYLNTPAKAAGMKPGDVIVAVKGEQLREPFEIRERVMLSPAKKPTPMLVIRDGKLKRLYVPLRRQTRPPALKLPPLIGRTVPNMEPGRLLLADLKQKIPYSAKKGTYLLYFWATWCGPCKMALPTMRKWQNSYGKLGYKTITLSNEKPGVVMKWLRKGRNAKRMPFINAYDLKRYDLFRKFRVQGTPTFVLIQNGRIKFVHIGFRKLGKFEKAIVRVLK